VIIGIDHVSMASADLAEALRLFEQFGLRLTYTEDLPGEGVRSNQIDAGNTSIEILEALRDDAPVVKFLRNRGPGLHHICFRVDDLEATIAQMQAAGLELVDPQPREDRQGRRVFLHPRSGGGVLMGFVERHPGQVP
jgi:methylmalonyl-CoA epimerase